MTRDERNWFEWLHMYVNGNPQGVVEGQHFY